MSRAADRTFTGRWVAMGLAAGAFVLFGCQQEVMLDACDIRRTRCQDDIFYAVQTLRGTAWDPWISRPPMRVITAEAYREELLAAERVPGDNQAVDHYEVALELLRLLDPERAPTASADARVDTVAAFYSPGAKAVTIIDHGDAGDQERGTLILAHELVHAAQDRDVGFGWAGTRDADDARLGIVEGEAELYENLVALAIHGVSVEDATWDEPSENALAWSRQRVREAESPEHYIYGLLYPLGSRYLTDRFLSGGNVAVRRVWGDLPRTSHQLMAESDGVARAENRLDCDAPEPPAGYGLARRVELGALRLFGVVTRFTEVVESADAGVGVPPVVADAGVGVPPAVADAGVGVPPITAERAWDLALGWAGDRLWLYSNGRDETLLSWQLRIARAQRERFLAGAKRLYGEKAVALADGRVLIALHNAAEPPELEGLQRCRRDDE